MGFSHQEIPLRAVDSLGSVRAGVATRKDATPRSGILNGDFIVRLVGERSGLSTTSQPHCASRKITGGNPRRPVAKTVQRPSVSPQKVAVRSDYGCQSHNEVTNGGKLMADLEDTHDQGRYPYTHHGPTVYGSKLADYLISEANLREDRPDLFESMEEAITRNIGSEMASKYDAAVCAALGMTKEEVVTIEPGRLTRSINGDSETLFLDGEPLVTFWPIETHSGMNGDTVMLNSSRKFTVHKAGPATDFS